MMKYSFLFLFVLSIVSCKKEPVSPNNPVSTSPAVFILADGAGNCYTPVVQGSYTAGTPLYAANKVIIQVNVSSAGTFSISTGSLNGYKFIGSGTLTATGLQSLTLQGSGSPIYGETDQFQIIPGSGCKINITVSDPPPPVIYDNDHMYFGNPSNASFSLDSINNYLMRKDYNALSYSSDRGTPNWVSWHLFSNDLGSVSRQDDFRPDNTLPAGWYQVQDYSYTATGFDRGHNTPSGDRTSTTEANSATFLMTNMIPQAPYHNQIVWSGMEDSLRRLVNQGNELYIIMGNYGTGGTGNNGYATTIDAGRVTVPANIWKIAIVISNGDNDSSRVNNNTRIIAVNIPNTNTLFSNWKNYRTSVDAIEDATGYDLISKLPVSLQAVLEARIDNL
jgi:DNA/RNA endonuclease G (NUC1)